MTPETNIPPRRPVPANGWPSAVAFIICCLGLFGLAAFLIIHAHPVWAALFFVTGFFLRAPRP